MPATPGIERLGRVKLKGRPADVRNLSGAGLVGDWLLIAGDESDRIQALRRRDDRYELVPGLEILLNDAGQEADIEGIATEGNTVYAVGSHSRKRPKPAKTGTLAENRRRIETIEPVSPFRDVLARFRFEDDGTVSDFRPATLRPLIEAQAVLQPFAGLPCKENGVDIEGLAVRDGRLFVGFRGPVLQRDFVPVLACGFEDPINGHDLLYLNLGGRGVRDLERVSDGFLVLAGPVNDLDAGFQLYHWNAADAIPGAMPEGRLTLLGSVPNEDGAKAEGLVVERETAECYTVLVLFDGQDDGGLTRFRARRPG